MDKDIRPMQAVTPTVGTPHSIFITSTGGVSVTLSTFLVPVLLQFAAVAAWLLQEQQQHQCNHQHRVAPVT